MKATGMIRHIDELGRIVIPKEIRRQMDIQNNDPVEIFVEGGRILLAKYEPTCIFCAGTEEVELFKGIFGTELQNNGDRGVGKDNRHKEKLIKLTQYHDRGNDDGPDQVEIGANIIGKNAPGWLCR